MVYDDAYIPDILSPEYDDVFDGKTPVEEQTALPQKIDKQNKVHVQMSTSTAVSDDSKIYSSANQIIESIMNILNGDNTIVHNDVEFTIYSAIIEEFCFLLKEVEMINDANEHKQYKSKVECILREFSEYSHKYSVLLEDLKSLEMKVIRQEKEIDAKNTAINDYSHEIDTVKYQNSIRTQNLKNFIQQLTLFKVPIGLYIMKQVQHNTGISSLDAIMKENHPEFVGYLSKDNSSKLNSMSELENKLLHVTEELELKINEHSFSIEKINKLSINNKELECKIQSLEKKLLESNSTGETMKNASLNIDSELKRIRKDNECLIMKCHQLELQIQNEGNKVKSLESKIEVLTNQNKEMELNLISVKGNVNKALTFDKMRIDHKKMSRENYTALAVDSIDQETLIDLQNIVKSIVITLEIPYYKLSKTIPLLTIRLYSENVALFAFADAIHAQLYGVSISHKNFRKAAYIEYLNTRDVHNINHPLKAVLESMYKKLIPKI